jgi:serine/threonine protein kinase
MPKSTFPAGRDCSADTIQSLHAILLEHDYDLNEVIGHGAYAAVFRVHSRSHNEDFAAKVTNIQDSVHGNANLSSICEEQALRAMDHPHIVRLYDSFAAGSFSILILELCTPTSIRDLIKQSKGQPIPKMRLLMAQLTDAVLFMHSRNYVHRDIKPSNVLLDVHGRAKLADFGMCIPFPKGELLESFAGSWAYRSPEMYEKSPHDPYKADVWALGVMFYEMAMGAIHWPKTLDLVVETVRNGGLVVDPSTPHDVAQLVKAMTQFDPQDRVSLEKVKRAIARSPDVKLTKFRSTANLVIGIRWTGGLQKRVRGAVMA